MIIIINIIIIIIIIIIIGPWDIYRVILQAYFMNFMHDILGTPCEIGHKRVPQNTSDGKSTLVQVMDWCH